MVEEKGQERDERKVIANCFLWCYTCSCLCVDLDWVFNNCQKKKKKVSSSLFPPLVPLNIPALSTLFLGLYVKPNFLLVSLDQSRWDKKENKKRECRRRGCFVVLRLFWRRKGDEGINKWVTPPQSSTRALKIVQKTLTYSTFVLFFSFIEVSKIPFHAKQYGECFF